MSATALLFLSASIMAPSEMAPTESKLRDYVRQLGDKSYRIRETAALALLKGGSASVTVLKEGMKDTDPEISERCRQLLPMAANLERNEKLAEFLKDTNSPPHVSLAGAERFLKITGDTKEAREMYAEMYALHHDVIDQCESNSSKAGELFGRFCDEAYNRWQTSIRTGRYSYDNIFSTRGDMTLFFFAASKPNLPRTGNYSRSQIMLNAPKITNALGSGAEGSPSFKKLFLSWLENESQSYMQSRGFQIAANANLKEALPVAKKLLARKDFQGYNQAQVMIAFVKFGDKDSIKDLEPFVENKSVVTTVNFGGLGAGGQKTVQVGDVALGVIIQLAGQKPADFGYDTRGNAAIMSSSYIYYGFGSDKEREACRAKWKEWATKNLTK